MIFPINDNLSDHHWIDAISKNVQKDDRSNIPELLAELLEVS